MELITQIPQNVNRKINIYSSYASFINHFFYSLAVKSFEGEILNLSKITRSEMGAYLCK